MKINPINYSYTPYFSGNAQRINKAYILTGETKDISLLSTRKNGSYVVDFDSQSEIIYGKNAVSYLNKTKYFEFDTQIIFPKNAKAKIYLQEGKTLEIPQNTAVLINENTKAKIEVVEGYPMVIISKKDYDWYQRHCAKVKDSNLKDKFLEIVSCNSHLYSGEFTPNSFLSPKMQDDEYLKNIFVDKWKVGNRLVDCIYMNRDKLNRTERKEIEEIKALISKLEKTKVIPKTQEGYFKIPLYNFDYFKTILLKQGFTQKEIKRIETVYNRSRTMVLESKITRKNPASLFQPSLIKKMKQKDILYNNQKGEDSIYWKKYYKDENALKKELIEKGFFEIEIQKIIQGWKDNNLSGFDVSGLKFINKNIAIYSLEEKINNWTQEPTHWITHSTELSSDKGIAPFVGVSIIQNPESKIFSMSDIRKEEKLHSHPNLDERRQTEIYLITSGASALNVVKNSKSCVKILKEGELAVVGPGVQHCVNSILGDYEHIVVQIPSAFQYGLSFKQIVNPPADYNEEKLKKEAHKALEKYKK